MTNNIDAMFIDWNGTLSNSVFWEHLKKSDNETFTQIRNQLFNESCETVNLWMMGKKNYEDIVDEISFTTGINASFILDELAISCRNIKLISDEIISLVASIRGRGIKVVIATDNMDVFDKYTVPALGLNNIFDDILNSYNLGAFKSEEDADGNLLFFNNWLNKNGIKIENTVLIDDSIKSKNFFENKGMRFMPINNEYSVIDYLKEI